MNHLKTFISTAAVTLMAISVAPASATILTDGTGTHLKTGTSLTAESEGITTWDAAMGTIQCNNSHVGGKTTNDGGEATSVSINLEALTWSKCNATMAVLAKGTLSIAWTSGSNGSLSSTGTELTIELFGLHCIFKTNGTPLGTLTGGSPATLDINANIPRTGGRSGAFCGSSTPWTGAYKFTNPSTMNIDSKPPPEGTVLTNPVGTQLGAGTKVTLESENQVAMHPAIGEIKCGVSHFGGQTTNAGGAGTSISVNIEDSTWSECNASLAVLAKGTLTITSIGGGNATLASTGTELTVVSGGFHCVFKTSSTKLGTLTGSVNTKGNATLDLEATIPRTGGSSGALCGNSAQWTGSYEVTSSSTLNID